MSIDFLEDIATLTRGQLGHGLHDWVSSRKLTANAPAGVYVIPSDDGACRPPTSAAEVTKGNGGVLELLVDRIANANGLEYASGDYGRYVTMGRIVMITEEAVSDQDPVYVRFATKGSNTQLGTARTDADGDGAETAVVTVITTADGAVIEFELNGAHIEYVSGSSETAAQKATALAAQIDAYAAFGAAAVGADVTITPVSGAAEFGSVPPAEIATTALGADSDPETAALLPRAFFEHDWPSGLALVKLG